MTELTCSDAPAPQVAAPRSNGTEHAYSYQTNQQLVAPPPAAPAPAQDQNAYYAAFASQSQQNGATNGMPPAPPFSFPQNVVPPPGFVPPPPPGATGQSALPPPPDGTNDITAQILQAMSAGLIAPDQAIQVLNAMAAAQNGGPPMPNLQPAVAPQIQLPFQPESHNPGQQNGIQTEQNDPNEGRYRDRSRSPDFQRRQSPPRRSPPSVNRRESPTYGVYEPGAGSDNSSNRLERGDRGRGRGKQRGGRNDRNEYRQRSPARRQPSPPRNAYGNSKYIDWDNTLPRDHIRVLSRTLFVGGAGGTEGEIRSIFSRFGQVQTCIVNLEKRHAFVKMLTRPDAVHAKEGMDNLQDPIAQSKARQVCIARVSQYLYADSHRHAGELASAPETAATTKAALALFPSPGLRTLIASGP
jgi:protein NRD1